MAIRIICVGEAGRDDLVHASDRYLDRLRHAVRVDVHQVSAGRRAKKSDDNRVRAQEAAAILKHADGAQLVALDQTGRALASEQLARALEGWLARGDVAFAIGGATGLHRDVLDGANVVLGFGPMTLPHRLARLVLSEQLYRAMSILRGEPYHK